MKQEGNSDRTRYWRAQVAAWQRSGLTQREYCKRQGVSEWSFSSWKRRLARSSAANADISFVPVAVVSQPALPKKEPSGAVSPLTLVVGSRYRLEVGEGFSGETLGRLLTVLGRL